MSIFSKARQLLNRKSENPDPNGDFRLTVLASIDMVSAFGVLLERPRSSFLEGMYQSETELPYAKDHIRTAIHVLQSVADNPRLTAILKQSVSPDICEKILAPRFQEALCFSDEMLEFFVSESEFREDQKKLKQIHEFLDNSAPQVRRAFDQIFPCDKPSSPTKR